MTRGWITYGPDNPGQFQMDLDRRMLHSTEKDGRTRVRLYRFVPPAVSLGFHQKESEVAIDLCREHGFDVVRRPTGGRAVLHKGDLVYSISISAVGVEEDGPMNRGVYNLVSLALIQGILELGIDGSN